MDKIKCKKCREEKGEEEFYWRKNEKISEYTCKKCYAIKNREYRNSEYGKKVIKEWKESEHGQKIIKNWRNSEHGQQVTKEWFESEHGKQVIKEYNESEHGKKIRKEWFESEAGRESIKKYNKTLKGKIKSARGNATRRNKKMTEFDDFTKEQWLQILENQEHKCNGCKVPFTEEKPATEDHIIPIGDGPGRTKENMQALCRSCNATKRRHSMEYLLKKLIVQKDEQCE